MNSEASSQTAEQRLVEQIKDWTNSRYIGDDCAILPGGLLVSVDSLAEGTHFSLKTTSLADLGWKSAAVNLSDIAAMAGRPRYLLMSLGFPPEMRESQIERFYAGFVDCARAFRVQIAGGDLIKSNSISISVTAIGDAHEHGVMRRDGAKPGDIIIVTGDFGASAAGLHLLAQQNETSDEIVFAERQAAANARSYCINRHLRPVPRLCEAWALNRSARGEGALMDASDGLADALVQLARASRVSLTVDLEKVPVHDETIDAAKKAGLDPLDWVLYGGEDYELVACVSEESWRKIRDANGAGNPFTAIGVVNGDFVVDGKVAEEASVSKISPESFVTLTSGLKPGPKLDLNRCYQHALASQ